MTNTRNTVLYTGVTNDLRRRAYEHREKLRDGFTKKYNVNKLVYYEVLDDPANAIFSANAIFREKQIKAAPRRKKVELVNGLNPEWVDLYDGL